MVRAKSIGRSVAIAVITLLFLAGVAWADNLVTRQPDLDGALQRADQLDD